MKPQQTPGVTFTRDSFTVSSRQKSSGSVSAWLLREIRTCR